jgi:hypothetical protein
MRPFCSNSAFFSVFKGLSKNFCRKDKLYYICNPKNREMHCHSCYLKSPQRRPYGGGRLNEVEDKWEHSSAGSEHLPYKQRVGGSNPSAPT